MDDDSSVQAPPLVTARSARLAAASIRFRYPVLLAALALTVACSLPAWDLIRLRVRTNFFSLLPRDHPSVQRLMTLVEKTGGLGDLMVVIDSSDPAANRVFAERLDASLADLTWINHREYRLDTSFLERNALLLIAPGDLETIETRLRERYEYELDRRDPMYVDLLEESAPALDFSDIEARYRRGDLLRPYHDSPDGRTLLIAIYPAGLSGEVKNSRRYLEVLRARVAAVDRAGLPSELRVRIGGTFADRLEEYDLIVRDLKRSGALMAALFLLLILWHFRQPAAVPLVFASFTMPLVWTFALARLLVGELNLITVFLVNVLSGLGVDFAYHTLSRYLEERSRGRSTRDALAIVNAWTLPACWSAAMTTALAFFVLMGTRFQGFRQFGIIAGCGLVFAFLSGTLVLPSLIAVAEDLRALRSRPSAELPIPLPRRNASRRVVLALGAAVALIGAWGATRLEFEYDMTKLRTALPAASRELRETIRSIFAGTRDPVVFMADDLDSTAKIQAILRERARTAGKANEIRSVLSVLDFVPPDQEARLLRLGRIRELLDEIEPFASRAGQARLAGFRRRLVARPVSIEELPDNLRWRFFGVPGTPGNLLYVLHRVPLTDTRRAGALVEQVRQVPVGSRIFYATSEAVVVDDLLRIMKEDSGRAISLSLLAVLVVMVFDLRSARRAAITVLPLVVGLLWMLAGMWVAGMKLNFYNMVVFPSILGMGVDSGIHVYHRFLEAPDRPIGEILRATRGAVGMSALTTMVSFGSMVVSVHQGLASLGLLAFVGLGSTLLAATVAFPVFLDRHRSLCR